MSRAIYTVCGKDFTEIEPYLDNLPAVLDGEDYASNLFISRSVLAPSHVDRGLFNLVIGSLDDLQGLQVQLREGEPMESVVSVFTGHIKGGLEGRNPLDQTKLYGILVPGLSMQFIDKRFRAPHHAGMFIIFFFFLCLFVVLICGDAAGN